MGDYNNCILYHSNCYDGFGAAYAAWKKLGDANLYLPCSYGFNVPDEVFKHKFQTIFILDFSFSEEVLFKLSKNCDKIVLLDHHKTAQEMLAPLIGKYDWLHIEFDMDRSGAKIAWEYFHSSESGDVPDNDLIDHISDRDLWKFELEGTKEVHKALVSYPMDFKLWDSFLVSDLISEGKVLSRMYDNLVNNICNSAFEKEVAGHKIMVVNTSIAWSEVGNRLLELYPDVEFAASFTVFENQTMWSLRSKGDFDVSKIAQKFGGGGHKNAAGFKAQRF